MAGGQGGLRGLWSRQQTNSRPPWGGGSVRKEGPGATVRPSPRPGSISPLPASSPFIASSKLSSSRSLAWFPPPLDATGTYLLEPRSPPIASPWCGHGRHSPIPRPRGRPQDLKRWPEPLSGLLMVSPRPGREGSPSSSHRGGDVLRSPQPGLCFFLSSALSLASEESSLVCPSLSQEEVVSGLPEGLESAMQGSQALKEAPPFWLHFEDSGTSHVES